MDEQPNFELSPEEEDEMTKGLLKIYIDSYNLTYYNVIDSNLDVLIELQKKKSEENQNTFIGKTKELYQAKNEEEYINHQQEAYYSTLYLEENKNALFAIFELKIIYAYKYFEIKLKELSAASFDDWTNKEIYKWEEIKKFYLTKNIKLSELENYQSVFDLGRVNNSLKHNGNRIGNKIRNIPEFKGADLLQYGHLHIFYERVKESTKALITEIASAINNELFKDDTSTSVKSEFDIDKLDEVLFF